ncbi:uncharacterized protein LOC106662948 [Cimex lectularius]|uniref:Gustatory receptor n=1 Tax=Cimex lectularius TaxID=79782 RepID=A0A8I6RBI9_CIMLE|nr:uncharacterized protein LOC106662948 [Cimex lectularius]
MFYLTIVDGYKWYSTWQFRTIISVKVIVFTITAMTNVKTMKTISFNELSILAKVDHKFMSAVALWPLVFHPCHIFSTGIEYAELYVGILFLSQEVVQVVIVIQFGYIFQAVNAVLQKVTSSMNAANLNSSVRKLTRLMELAQFVHRRYTIQLFFILIYSHINCLIWGFHIVKDIDKADVTKNVYFFIMRIIYFLWNVGITKLIVSPNTQFKEQVELFMNKLQKRLHETRMDKRTLCLYLRLQRCPEFKALSLFSLNNSLVTSVAAAVCAYIIIITQFFEEMNLYY